MSEVVDIFVSCHVLKVTILISLLMSLVVVMVSCMMCGGFVDRFHWRSVKVTGIGNLIATLDLWLLFRGNCRSCYQDRTKELEFKTKILTTMHLGL